MESFLITMGSLRVELENIYSLKDIGISGGLVEV